MNKATAPRPGTWPDSDTHDPALAAALLELDATHTRVDELSDRVTELELENHELRERR